MKKIFYSVLISAVVIFVVGSCSNGAYNANPDSNANSSINPLNPLKISDFTWGGDTPMSGDINGSHWVAQYATFATDSSGASVVTGIDTAGGKYSVMSFHLRIYKIVSDNLFDMGFHKYDTWGSYDANILLSSLSGTGPSLSYLGNSGEIDITENDSAFIKAKFYFQGVDAKGNVINVTNGNIDVTKIP